MFVCNKFDINLKLPEFNCDRATREKNLWRQSVFGLLRPNERSRWTMPSFECRGPMRAMRRLHLKGWFWISYGGLSRCVSTRPFQVAPSEKVWVYMSRGRKRLSSCKDGRKIFFRRLIFSSWLGWGRKEVFVFFCCVFQFRWIGYWPPFCRPLRFGFFRLWTEEANNIFNLSV